MLDQNIGLDPAQVKALAARQDGHRHLADLGGGKNELGVRRRLFQRLEQGIERALGQHVHLIDHIDLVARLNRAIAHTVQKIAHIIDASAAGGIQLQHIHVPTIDDGAAMAALGGQIHTGAMLRFAVEIQGPGQEPRRRGLTDPAHAGQHKGMGYAPRRKSIGQGADHGLLANQILKGARPIFAGQDLIGGIGIQRGWRGSGDRRAKHILRRSIALGWFTIPRLTGPQITVPGRGLRIVRIGH